MVCIKISDKAEREEAALELLCNGKVVSIVGEFVCFETNTDSTYKERYVTATVTCP